MNKSNSLTTVIYSLPRYEGLSLPVILPDDLRNLRLSENQIYPFIIPIFSIGKFLIVLYRILILRLVCCSSIGKETDTYKQSTRGKFC